MKKTIYITNIFPLYRKSLWEKLLHNTSFDLDIYFSDYNPIGIKNVNKTSLDPKIQSHLKKIKNLWFFDRIIIWQKGVIKLAALSTYDNLMFLGEFQILSTWIAILIAKMRGKKILLWSHGLYGNESYLKKKLRILFYSFAQINIVYEKKAKQLLINEGFKAETIEVVYNSLNFDKQNLIYSKLENREYVNPINFFNNKSLHTVFFVGRITPQKRINELIDSLAILNNNGAKYNLLIIGDGSILNKLKNQYDDFIELGWLCFFGATYNENELANLIYHSDLCVSPGNIGLTAIHSLTYGTSVASHSNFMNQMPEVEIIEEGINGFLFRENSVEDLAFKIENFFNTKRKSKKVIRNKIVELYNPENQLDVFKKILS
ncbi:glycosyltransferase [Flavobacteriaceae bacterium]|nr:glycosyltransferase [Flavobacteriaceae bacterium]